MNELVEKEKRIDGFDYEKRSLLMKKMILKAHFERKDHPSLLLFYIKENQNHREMASADIRIY